MKMAIAQSLLCVAGAGLILGCSTPVSESDTNAGSVIPPESVPAESIKVDGSSTVYPLTQEVAFELQFEREAEAPQVTVEFSGTGGGFRKFCAGETDINNASRPILQDEMEVCAQNGVEYIELPVAFDALTVVVNENNDWATDITVEELKTIWESAAEGEITRWNQVRADWPDRPLNLYGADADSGTYDYFTEAILETSGESRQDYTAESDDERIVRAVRTDPDALGFFGYAYYQESQTTLKALPIDNGDGAIVPSDETVRSGTYQPLTRPLFIYVNREHLDENPALQDFVTYYLIHAPFLTRTVGYTPLPEEAYSAISDRFDQRIVGTVFDGQAPTDLTLEQLTQLEQ